MDATDVIDRLHAIDPVTDDALEALLASRPIADLHARTVAEPRPAPARKHRAHPSRRTTLLAVASVVAVTALGLAVVEVVGEPGGVGGPKTASAAELFTQAGTVARSLPATVSLTGTERVYSGVVYDAPSDSGDGAPTDPLVRLGFLTEQWVQPDGGYLERTKGLSPLAARMFEVLPAETRVSAAEVKSGKSPSGPAIAPFSAAELAAIPTDPAGLAAYVDERAKSEGVTSIMDSVEGASSESSADAKAAVAANLLQAPLAPPALRGAVFDLLATYPGITSEGPVTDSLGRAGVGVTLSAQSDGEGRDTVHLVFDPETATVLELRVISTMAALREMYAEAPLTAADLETKVVFVGPVVVSDERVRPPGVRLDGSTLVAPQPTVVAGR